MKTPTQWLMEKDPAWGDVRGKPELTAEVIGEIQRDAIVHAAVLAEKIGDSVGQDNPNTGELSEADADRAQGCYQVAERLRLELTLLTL